jgi:CheY-like chemotaxis protein
MNSGLILPLCHPTSVVLVDDNTDFLHNLSLHLDPMLAFHLFEHPSAALRKIDGEKKLQSLLRAHQGPEESLPGRQLVDLDIGGLWRRVTLPTRFDLTSVAVVDYDMPEMNGLEFCRRLGGSDVRKILLTGKADEAIAISAFNNGLIDRYIVKQRADALEMLNMEILDLQLRFMAELLRPLTEVIASGSFRFLKDPAFIDYFQRQHADFNIVEEFPASTRGEGGFGSTGKH